MSERNALKKLYFKMKNYIRDFIEIELGVKMPSRRTTIKVSRGVEDIAKAFVSVIFILYGFLAFTNPDQYPILRKIVTFSIINKIDPLIGLLLVIAGLYLLFRK